MNKIFESGDGSMPRPSFNIHVKSFESLDEAVASDAVSFISNSISAIYPYNPILHTPVHIYRSEIERPQCGRLDDGVYILIDDPGCEEFQWIFQLAHEYMHYFIGGNLSGEKNGLWWFEEIVCCLSSIYHLWYHSTLWPDRVLSSRTSQTLSASQYLELFFEAHRNLSDDFRGMTHPADWLATLSKVVEYNPAQYDYFHAVAACMLQWFQKNPNLWKFVLSLKNARSHMSLTSILPTLMQEADCTYSKDLSDMFSYLLPRLENNVNFVLS